MSKQQNGGRQWLGKADVYMLKTDTMYEEDREGIFCLLTMKLQNHKANWCSAISLHYPLDIASQSPEIGSLRSASG